MNAVKDVKRPRRLKVPQMQKRSGTRDTAGMTLASA